MKWANKKQNNIYNVAFFLKILFSLLYSPSKNQKKNKILKYENICWGYQHFTQALRYIYMCTINEDHMIYDSWNIRCNREKFLSFWAIFCPFSPLTTQKIKILKLKKTPGDIIILHICTTNDNHMMYGSWDMEHNRQIFLSFWAIYSPFTHRRTQKIKILKKWKTHLKILSFYKCVP